VVVYAEKEVDPVTLLKMAVESITAHKLRSFLVTMGILIGITAVLVNAAMVQGFRNYFQQQIQTLGSNFVSIQPGSSYGLLGTTTKENDLLAPYLFDAVSRLPFVDAATADRETFGTLSYMGEQATVIVVGIEPGFFEAMNREMLAGGSLTSQDTFNAVLAESVLSQFSRRSFVLMSNFDLTVTVNGKNVTDKFRVKGIVKQAQPDIGIGILYVPIKTLNSMMGQEGYTAITLTTSDVNNIDTIKVEVQQMLDQVLKVPPQQVASTEEQTKELFGIVPAPFQSQDKPYIITTQADVLDISNKITSMIQLALVAIAGISLLVGGIGIANVMLVTVRERTREIGVMKAVGAKNRHVLIAFLFESCVIGLLGGILGMAVAATASFISIPLLFHVAGSLPLEWAIIAIGICLTISLLSGLYPALRASKMDPVEALRSE
jgi:putative ABC transport system permease protein